VPRLALLVMSVFVAFPAFAITPVVRDFHDWHVSCSSIASACAAWTGSEAGEGYLIVRRAHARQVDRELRLHMPAGILADVQTLELDVDGLRETLQRGRDWYEGELAGEAVLIDGPDGYRASRLFAAMGKAGSLSLRAGGFRSRFSLHGLTASLLWIDESQGRKDVWALIQTPATHPEVAPAVRLVQRRYADETVLANIVTLPPAVRGLRQQAGDCMSLAEAADGRGYQVQWLDAYTALFSVPCQLTAQEPLHLHVVAHAPDFADARAIGFPLWDEGQLPSGAFDRPVTTTVPTLALPELQPVFARLQLVQQDFHGELEQTWRWDGRAMQLIEVRRKMMEGEASVSWQVLWQELAVRR